MKTELSNVVIVGKPNVGKSTLFNRLIQKKVAITSEIAGTTRDRIVQKVEWLNRKFNLIDTGGLTKDVTISFQTEINMQVEIALQYADLIVFVVSTKDGITAEDEYVAKKLKQYDKKVVLVANKADNKEMTVASSQFYKLGFGAPIPISSVHGINTSKLLDEIIKNIKTSKAKDSKILRIGIIGKPNVGKSTFLNKLLNEDRVIVSDVAGTTRDSIDTQFSIDGNDYILVDTAGIKKNKRALDDIAFYSELRSNLTVETSDIIFLVLDNSQGLQHIDESILQFLKESYKPTIALINKSDLLTEAKKKEIELEIENSFRFASYVPTIFISAKTGKGFNKIFELVEKIKHAMKLQIDQTTLNKFVRELLFIKQPPRQQGRHVSIDSIQFENKKVPTFEIYSNNPDFVHFSYQRFLEKQLRLIFDLEGIPIRVVYRRT